VRPQDEALADEVLPALSAEEWLQYGANRAILREFAADRRPWGPRRRSSYEEKLHAAAAMALYDQSFGFQPDDVQLLRAEADLHERNGTREDVERAAWMRGLAARIAALLPPHGIRPQPPQSAV
jgi:hypothetical protein